MIWVAGNWKMNHGPLAAAQFIDKLHSDWERGLSERTRQRLAAGQVKALIFPPALSIATCSELVRNTGLPIHLGTQNAHGEKSGAYTGEISVSMLQEAILPSRGIVLVGHSERRQLFGEMPEATWQRTLGIMNQGATVLFCVGETQKEREAGQTRSVLHAQLKGLTLGNDAQNRGRLMIAYEPVWAIGTGLTATPEQARETHREIREILSGIIDPDFASHVALLYGGSVTPQNFEALLSEPGIDGGLVGGASLKVESFLELLEIAGRRD